VYAVVYLHANFILPSFYGRLWRRIDARGYALAETAVKCQPRVAFTAGT